ncbi:hypothetical protein [Blastococcus sp. PRF04-17]|uniref:hypothetical protein n=1 Tax=Blastococcus sp. PRF04-17 TaxID=2933797 RepID=UPI001FF10AF2|nr:hypothetical protein [Blastococcus sp. PRF04-17]UOY00809.1 hypothetical protein MVA48_17765 [Blastococcus sp. PRF04-17]
MTSGQGGPYGGQYPGPEGQGGQPQGWNAPPPPQQSYPGYGPAPSAPVGHGAPQAMERPSTVRFGIGAFVASLIIGAISSVVAFGNVDQIVAQTMATTDDPAVTEEVIRTGIVIGAVIALIIYALFALFLWFAWQGRNWARVVLWVLGGISVVFGLVGLAAPAPGQSGFQTSLGWFSFLLTLAGIVLLALKPSNDWYRFRGWQRATGQG